MAASLKPGDTFKIPYGSDSHALGVLVRKRTLVSWLVAIWVEPANAPTQDPDFLAFCIPDNAIHRSDWPKQPEKLSLDFPEERFTLDRRGTMIVMDGDGNYIRDRRPTDIGVLKGPNTVSPGWIKKAVEASANLRPWEAKFNEFTYDTFMIRSSAMDDNEVA